MKRRFAFLSMCAVFISAFACADQIVLTNGDRLTGDIVKSDSNVLTLKTDFAGSIDIKWSAIQQLTSDKPVFVQNSADKKTYSGSVSTEGDNLVIKTQSGQTESIPKASVAAVRSTAEQAAYEKQQHPGFLQGWSGGANVSFALTGGNSETKNLGLAFTAVRTGRRDKLGLSASSVYATNDAPGAIPSTTANLEQGSARYDHDLNQVLFGFVSADFMADALQTLNLRSVFTGGLGYHVIKTSNTTLDLLSGVNYTRESYVQFSRNFAGLTLGEELTRKWSHGTVISEKADFYPDLSDAGEYRADFNLGTVTKLNRWFGWQNTFSDIYVTNPPSGKKRNDTVFTTGLNFSFAH